MSQVIDLQQVRLQRIGAPPTTGFKADVFVGEDSPQLADSHVEAMPLEGGVALITVGTCFVLGPQEAVRLAWQILDWVCGSAHE